MILNEVIGNVNMDYIKSEFIMARKVNLYFNTILKTLDRHKRTTVDHVVDFIQVS